MGVPSFYRWLANRYPKIVVNAVEKNEDDYTNTDKPNGFDFDNLYLDMNGIIHPCFHPEQDDEANDPLTHDEVFNNIFEYIDRILNIVRPRKLMYMAIDGVAPRAKMNQQRTRRFRTAKDRQTLDEEENRLRKRYELEGKILFPKVESEIEDSNVITPGTEFMYDLSKQLQAYIRLRVANNPAWRHLRVILSDASSPGEGEHKIMSFIRLQRTCEGYDPNTSHVLYGLDADLIMLALTTHEIHFSILRENVLAEAARSSKSKFDLIRGVDDTAKKISSLHISEVKKKKSLIKKPHQFLHVWILREYLKLDLEIIDMPEKFVPDTERLIDDFIFICFFAGNDFLPRMPTLEIHEGAIDLLMHVYTEEFKNLGGYLLDVERIKDKKGCYIKLKRVEKFILAVGAYEDKIFKKRSAIHNSKLKKMLSDIQAAEGHDEEDFFPSIDRPCSSISSNRETQMVENTKMLKEQLKAYTRKVSDVFKNGLQTDLVKFGSPGWRERYYQAKFSVATAEDVEKIRKDVVEKYTQGLCWVLLYYFSDVPSWTWYYPYHYGPFASDFKGLSSTKITFEKGVPFKPFNQLMAVLPPPSAHALPTPYKLLMTHDESSILDFYPREFDTDVDGKRFLWQGICKLPFIDEVRLLAATKKIQNELSAEEIKRNVENRDHLYAHSSEKFASRIKSSINDVGLIDQSNSVKIDSGPSEINGFVGLEVDSMKDPHVLCVKYELPNFSPHMPRVLAGSSIPETVVNEADLEERQLWHDSFGYHNSRNNRSYTRREGSDGNPLRNSCPDAINLGGRSGWNPKGRDKAQQPPHGFDGGLYQGQSSRPLHGNSRPEAVSIRGGGSGWNPRGRGIIKQPPHSSSSGACHHDQIKSRSWWGNACPEVARTHDQSGLNTRGRGEVEHSPNLYRRGSNNQSRGRSWSGSTRGNGTARGFTNHLNRDNSDGKFWSGSSRWNDKHSRHDRDDTNTGRW